MHSFIVDELRKIQILTREIPDLALRCGVLEDQIHVRFEGIASGVREVVLVLLRDS